MNCKYCNLEFQSKISNKIFCSYKCRYNYNKYIKTNNVCLVCGTKTNNPKFCSMSCSAIYNNVQYPKRRPEGHCNDCGISISSTRHRCKACNVKFNRLRSIPKGTGKTLSIKICVICGEEYLGNHISKYCSKECKNVHKKKNIARFKIGLDLQLKDAIYEYQHKSSAFALVRSRARSMIKYYKIPESCIVCGYSKHIEVCHIKPISSFSEEAFLSDINALDNLVCLCPNCHWEFDNGFISIEDIRKQQLS